MTSSKYLRHGRAIVMCVLNLKEIILKETTSTNSGKVTFFTVEHLGFAAAVLVITLVTLLSNLIPKPLPLKLKLLHTLFYYRSSK